MTRRAAAATKSRRCGGITSQGQPCRNRVSGPGSCGRCVGVPDGQFRANGQQSNGTATVAATNPIDTPAAPTVPQAQIAWQGQFADGKPVHVNNANGKDVDPYGFRFDHTHVETGTRFDPDGYNFAGRDRYGFDRNGTYQDRHRGAAHVGDRYDPHGFDRDGIHKSGGSRDGAGRDRDGYLEDGFDEDGVRWEGSAWDKGLGATRDGQVVYEAATEVIFADGPSGREHTEPVTLRMAPQGDVTPDGQVPYRATLDGPSATVEVTFSVPVTSRTVTLRQLSEGTHDSDVLVDLNDKYEEASRERHAAGPEF